MFIVYVPPGKLFVAALAMKSLSEVDTDNVAVDRVIAHRTGGAPAPQTLALDCATSICMFLSVPFLDVGTDVGSGTNDPHFAGVAGFGPPALMDADHGIILAGAGEEILLVDPHPSDVDGASTLETSATRAFLLWGPMDHDWRQPPVADKFCSIVFGRGWRGR